MISRAIRKCFPAAARVVSEKAEEINKLNVFPVPDGDTGTNMSQTITSAIKEINSKPYTSAADVAGAALV